MNPVVLAAHGWFTVHKSITPHLAPVDFESAAFCASIMVWFHHIRGLDVAMWSSSA